MVLWLWRKEYNPKLQVYLRGHQYKVSVGLTDACTLLLLESAAMLVVMLVMLVVALAAMVMVQVTTGDLVMVMTDMGAELGARIRLEKVLALGGWCSTSPHSSPLHYTAPHSTSPLHPRVGGDPAGAAGAAQGPGQGGGHRHREDPLQVTHSRATLV